MFDRCFTVSLVPHTKTKPRFHIGIKANQDQTPKNVSFTFYGLTDGTTLRCGCFSQHAKLVTPHLSLVSCFSDLSSPSFLSTSSAPSGWNSSLTLFLSTFLYSSFSPYSFSSSSSSSSSSDPEELLSSELESSLDVVSYLGQKGATAAQTVKVSAFACDTLPTRTPNKRKGRRWQQLYPQLEHKL